VFYGSTVALAACVRALSERVWKDMIERIIIENAKSGDLTQIKNLLLDLIDGIENTENIDIDNALSNCRQMIDEPNSHILLAKLENDVVGFLNLTTRTTILHSAPSALIDELVVAKACRGRGIGKVLMEAATDKCRDLGCCEVEVSTEMTNEKARAFYRSCGFEEDSVLLEYDLD